MAGRSSDFRVLHSVNMKLNLLRLDVPFLEKSERDVFGSQFEEETAKWRIVSENVLMSLALF